MSDYSPPRRRGRGVKRRAKTRRRKEDFFGQWKGEREWGGIDWLLVIAYILLVVWSRGRLCRWELGPGTWVLGPKNGDLGPGCWDLGDGIWDLGAGAFLDRFSLIIFH